MSLLEIVVSALKIGNHILGNIYEYAVKEYSVAEKKRSLIHACLRLRLF